MGHSPAEVCHRQGGRGTCSCGASDRAVFDRVSRAAMRFRMLSALLPDPTGTLNDSDLWSLVAIYVTWYRRVPAAYRGVHLSRELLANPAREQYGDGLAAI